MAWLRWALCTSTIGFEFRSSLSPCLSDPAWLHPTDVLSCCSWTQYHSKPTHTPCHILDTVWGPWCRKEATWGLKSSVVVGWLYNLIAWIVSFLFFVVKFLFFCSFLASSCATYSCQTSTGPDITARLLGDNVIGQWTTCEHITVPLNINEVTRKHNLLWHRRAHL